MVHEERFEARHGPLRHVVENVVAQFLDRGRLHARNESQGSRPIEAVALHVGAFADSHELT